MLEINDFDTEEESNELKYCDLLSMDSIKKECLVSPHANEHSCVQCGNILIPQIAYQHSCQALMCKGCSNTSILGKSKCAKCNEAISQESIYLVEDPELWAQLSSIEINCPFINKGADEKCKWAGKLEDLITHATSECINTQIKCKFKCGTTMPGSTYSTHLKECKNRKVKCKYCNKRIYYWSLNNHIKNECESPNNLERQIKCSLSYLGCDYIGFRSDVMKHQKDFKVHLQLSQKKIIQLQSDNQAMTAKMLEIKARHQLIEDNMPAIMRCPANHFLQKNQGAQQKCRICNSSITKFWMCIPCKYYICKSCHSIKKNLLPLCPINDLHCMMPKDSTSKCSACQEDDKKILFWCPLCSYNMCKRCAENNQLI
jgi:hypothetical protein